MIAEDSNDDYKSVCINSTNQETNVYKYCSGKNTKDKSLLRFCKLDMCNLCCVTMDPMKKKNYSVENMKKCFYACSDKFNHE